jgi:Tol biopolymer transport system component/predicted Ser/Thr protein kinase
LARHYAGREPPSEIPLALSEVEGSEARNLLLNPGTKLGPYEITSAIGAGGMGEVYKATDTRLDRIVAIKVLPAHLADKPELRERFEREARTIASLNHPHICTLHDIGRQDGTDFLVMEYLEGETLAQRLVKGPLPLEQVLQFAIEIADALDKAHRNGVTHRDLKPGNIMLTKSGTKLLDFGLAKLRQDAAPSTPFSQLPTQAVNMTAQGMILGTLQYMAPEQAEGGEVDARTDIFAFGAVVYEMATSKKAFEGKTSASVMAKILEVDPPLMASFQPMTPPALDRVVKRCLAKDPEDRWQTARDLEMELKWVAEGGSQAAMPAPVAAQRQRPFGWIAAAVLLVLLAGVSYVHFREVPREQPSVRFEVPPPEKAAAQVFRLSPDGRYLAIRVPEGGRNRIWLRPLNSLQAQPLPGTDGASYPFWSPEGTFLAFFAQDKLKKIAISGGPPQTLCEAPAARGGTWNRDGVIVFSGLAGGLNRVPAAGGVPAPLGHLRTSGAGDFQRFPEFLPDGRHILYLQSTAQAETTGVYVGSLDTRPPARLLPEQSNAIYVPPIGSGRTGHLLFRRENALMAQPFDPARLQTTGEMFPVAEQVGAGANTGFGAFSASDGGVLAYGTGALVNRELVWLDRTGKRLGPIGKPGAFTEAALSPDEKTIALRVGSDAAGDVWLQDLTRGVVSRFTFLSGSTLLPVWSPDGSRIVFTNLLGGSSSFSMYLKAASGAGKEELLKSGGINVFPWDWSRDGKFVVFSEFSAKTGDDLWLLPLEGDHKPIPYLQTPFSETQGRFSPDGRWMAYVSNESGQDQVYVQTIPVSGAKWQVSTSGGGEPRWRRDGRELFYVASDQTLMAVPVKFGGAGSGSFEAGAPQPLFPVEPSPTNYTALPYQPTADGQRFLVNVTGGDTSAAPPITVVLNWTAGLKK